MYANQQFRRGFTEISRDDGPSGSSSGRCSKCRRTAAFVVFLQWKSTIQPQLQFRLVQRWSRPLADRGGDVAAADKVGFTMGSCLSIVRLVILIINRQE